MDRDQSCPCLGSYTMQTAQLVPSALFRFWFQRYQLSRKRGLLFSKKFLQPHLLLRAVLNPALQKTQYNSGKCVELQLSSTARGMKKILNTKNIFFKYFSWQLELTPPQNSWILFCQKNSALASHSLWFSEGLRGYLIPLFPYLVVLLLSQHMHTNMAQPQSADGMMSRRYDCCGLCSHLEDRERR